MHEKENREGTRKGHDSLAAFPPNPTTLVLGFRLTYSVDFDDVLYFGSNESRMVGNEKPLNQLPSSGSENEIHVNT